MGSSQDLGLPPSYTTEDDTPTNSPQHGSSMRLLPKQNEARSSTSDDPLRASDALRRDAYLAASQKFSATASQQSYSRP